MTKPKYAFFDVETSGLHPMGNSLLTLAMYITDADYNILGEFYEKCHPGFTIQSYHVGTFEHTLWSQEAEKTHGISWKEAQTFQWPTEFCSRFISFLCGIRRSDSERLTLVYHANTPFDIRFLLSHFFKWDEVGYFQLQRYFHPERTENTMAMAREFNRRGSDVLKQMEKHQKTIDKMDDYLLKPRKTAAKPDKILEWETKKNEATMGLNNLQAGHKPFEGVSLDKICKALDIPLTHHDASSDARALIPIHKFLREQLGDPSFSQETNLTAAA